MRKAAKKMVFVLMATIVFLFSFGGAASAYSGYVQQEIDLGYVDAGSAGFDISVSGYVTFPSVSGGQSTITAKLLYLLPNGTWLTLQGKQYTKDANGTPQYFHFYDLRETGYQPTAKRGTYKLVILTGTSSATISNLNYNITAY